MSHVKIGWAKREISMEGPLSVPGQMYMRISEGIHDPLMTTALCVDGGEGQDVVIFCSCDIVVLRGGVIPQTLEKVAAMRPEIPANCIIMNATHTHAGACATDTPERSPDGKEIYSGAKYRDFLTTQCAEAICEAWDTRAEGGMGYGYGYAVVGHSRRTIFLEDQGSDNVMSGAPNGYGVMYGNTAKDSFSHYEAGSDHYLNLMFTFDAAQKLTGIVVNVPCPSQLSEWFTQLSADFWHEVRALVKKEYGENVFVMPQCAAAGDLSPRTLHYKEAQIRRMALKYGISYKLSNTTYEDRYNKTMTERYDIAERIMNGIREVYGWARKDIQTDVEVRHVCRALPLSRRVITEAEKIKCEDNIRRLDEHLEELKQGTPEEIRRNVSRYNSYRNRNARAIERFETLKTEPTMDVMTHMAQIGDIAFATTRFELYMDFMHRLQARSPFLQTFVIQLAGDEGGSYLPTHRGVANKGYSASIYCNQIGPEGGQEWVEACVSVLKDMKSQSEG